MSDFNPETVGAIIGGAVITIATALGIITRRKPPAKSKKDTGEQERVNIVIDIVSDLRDQVEALEEALEQSKKDCTKRIDEIVEKYDRQLSEMAVKNAELKRRLDQAEATP